MGWGARNVCGRYSRAPSDKRHRANPPGSPSGQPLSETRERARCQGWSAMRVCSWPERSWPLDPAGEGRTQGGPRPYSDGEATGGAVLNPATAGPFGGGVGLDPAARDHESARSSWYTKRASQAADSFPRMPTLGDSGIVEDVGVSGCPRVESTLGDCEPSCRALRYEQVHSQLLAGRQISSLPSFNPARRTGACGPSDRTSS